MAQKYMAILCCAVVVAAGIVLFGCEHKFDLSVLPNPGQRVTIGDTDYVEIFPPIGGFENPRAVAIGNDQLIYVADYDKNEVVMLDASGAVLKRRSVPHPVAIVQNLKLDLLIGGETIAPNGVDTIGAIYRLYLARFDTSYVSRIDTVINSSTGDTTISIVRRDTSYIENHDLENAPMRVVWDEPAHPLRRFKGIGVFPGNEYLVARTGPDNSSFVDPDARVLLFSKDDILETPLGDLVTRPSGGTAVTDIKDLTGMMTFPSTRDFIVTQNGDGVAYGAIWMVYQNTPDFVGWLPKYDPSNATQRGSDFVKPYRFQNAAAAAYDKRRREIFIVDSGMDSVLKFDRNGQFRKESFGKFKTTSNLFRGLDHPSGVAFSSDCTLYIADSGNRVVRRFKLSSQTQCN